MSPAVLFVLLAFQGAWPHQYSEFDLQRMSAFASRVDAAQAQHEAAWQQRDFEERFNRLIDTMKDFADCYNRDRAIDVKKAEAVRRAWRELERSEGWFRSKKSK